MPLGTDVGCKPRPRRRYVRWGRSSPSPLKGAQPPVFGPCLLWPLGTKVDLGPGHTVLDGDPAPPAKGAQQPRPLFSAYVYCGHGRPSQLLLSSCYVWGGRGGHLTWFHKIRFMICYVFWDWVNVQISDVLMKGQSLCLARLWEVVKIINSKTDKLIFKIHVHRTDMNELGQLKFRTT